MQRSLSRNVKGVRLKGPVSGKGTGLGPWLGPVPCIGPGQGPKPGLGQGPGSRPGLGTGLGLVLGLGQVWCRVWGWVRDQGLVWVGSVSGPGAEAGSGAGV